jgi:histone H3/H4
LACHTTVNSKRFYTSNKAILTRGSTKEVTNSMAELPLAPVKRIIKQAGAERVSEDAVEELRDELEDHASERARDSKQMAEHAGRKTVQEDDVKASA